MSLLLRRRHLLNVPAGACSNEVNIVARLSFLVKNFAPFARHFYHTVNNLDQVLVGHRAKDPKAFDLIYFKIVRHNVPEVFQVVALRNNR